MPTLPHGFHPFARTRGWSSERDKSRTCLSSCYFALASVAGSGRLRGRTGPELIYRLARTRTSSAVSVAHGFGHRGPLFESTVAQVALLVPSPPVRVVRWLVGGFHTGSESTWLNTTRDRVVDAHDTPRLRTVRPGPTTPDSAGRFGSRRNWFKGFIPLNRFHPIRKEMRIPPLRSARQMESDVSPGSSVTPGRVSPNAM